MVTNNHKQHPTRRHDGKEDLFIERSGDPLEYHARGWQEKCVYGILGESEHSEDDGCCWRLF
jgi:hypothetical protein